MRFRKLTVQPASMLVAGLIAVAMGAPLAARAQLGVSVGGGWSYRSVSPLGTTFANKYNLTLSLTPASQARVHLRVDGVAFLSENQKNLNLNVPDCFPGCSRPEQVQYRSVTIGLLANAVVALDPARYTYLLAGAGVYRAQIDEAVTELRPGLALGGGVNIPLLPHASLFVEARWHWLGPSKIGPSWYVPITLGFRSR